MTALAMGKRRRAPPWIARDEAHRREGRTRAKARERRARENAFRRTTTTTTTTNGFGNENGHEHGRGNGNGNAGDEWENDDEDAPGDGDGDVGKRQKRRHSSERARAVDGDGEQKEAEEEKGDGRRRRRGSDEGDLSAVNVDPGTFPWHPPRQTRDGLTAEEFERRRARVEEATRDVGARARFKQLRRACHIFVSLIRDEGLVPTPYTYASLLNAYVNTGAMDGAEALMKRMNDVGCAPNVVAYTTMLKGYMLVADVDAAKKTIEGMKHPNSPDIRAINTYIRVCVRCGDLAKAMEAYDNMRKWDVVPDASTHKLVGRLLAQGLKIDELKTLIKSVRKGEHLRWTNDQSCGPCQFWRSGKCERGVNCRFFHDAAVAQDDAAARDVENNDMMAHLHVNCAHAMAMTGDIKGCRKYIAKASKYLADERGGSIHGGKDERAELYKSTNRDELRLEVQRISTFVDRVLDGTLRAPVLHEHFARTLIFSSRILALCARGEGSSAVDVDRVRESLYEALRNTMGLRDDSKSVKKAIYKIISDDGTIRFDKMFDRSKKDKTRALNLEVAAGNGDWAVAQAKASKSDADWISLELRHDRVYSIFSRAVCEGTSNFAAMGGDAAHVMRRYIKPGSVSNVFVNFPEPPHHSGDASADNSLALLNENFFRDIHESLCVGGALVIFSDNHRYTQSLARVLGDLGIFNAREADVSSAGVEIVNDVRVYKGIPGPQCGHRVYEQSYFDRFWQQGQHVDRYFISVVKS